MAEESGATDATVGAKFDMPSHESKMTTKDVKNMVRKYNVLLDLHPCALTKGLLFACGLATTWDFPCLFPVFKDTEGNGSSHSSNNPIRQNTTPHLAADKSILDKTDSQIEVEVEDPKVIAAREKKKAQVAHAAAKKKDDRKRANEEGGNSKVKKRRVQENPKDVTASSDCVSSPTPLQTIVP
ncbi:hypothetical protein Tco_0587044 [Tanacetum coccineum]